MVYKNREVVKYFFFIEKGDPGSNAYLKGSLNYILETR